VTQTQPRVAPMKVQNNEMRSNGRLTF